MYGAVTSQRFLSQVGLTATSAGRLSAPQYQPGKARRAVPRAVCRSVGRVIALGRLGWSLQRIQQAIRKGGWGRCAPAKPAIEVTTDFGAELSDLTRQ